MDLYSILIEIFGGWLIGKGLDAAWNKIFKKKIEDKKLTSTENQLLTDAAHLIQYHVDDFQNRFEAELNNHIFELRNKQSELLDAINALGILPQQIDVKSIINKVVNSPFELFVDLETFLDRVDVELRETKSYVERGDEVKVLDEFLDSGNKLLLIHGEPGIGKTRLLIEYTKSLEVKGWQGLFCSKLGNPTDREYATAIEGLSKGKNLIILADKIEEVPNLKTILDFLIATPSLDFDNDVKVIGSTVSPQKITREDLHRITTIYELRTFPTLEGLKEIARKNFPVAATNIDLNRMAQACQGYPDAVIAIFNLLKQGDVSFEELSDRDRILNRRFEVMYNELGRYKFALAIMAAVRMIREVDLKIYNDLYADYGEGTFTRALNDDKLKTYVFQGEDLFGEPVRYFIARELFASYLVKKVFLDGGAIGDLARLADCVAKTHIVALFVSTILSFHNNDNYKNKCDRAVETFLKTTQEEAPLDAVMAALPHLPWLYSRKAVIYKSIDWERLKKRLPEYQDPFVRANAVLEICRALFKLEKTDQTQEWFNYCLKTARESKCFSQVVEVTKTLSSLLSNIGEHEKAFDVLEGLKEHHEKMGVKPVAARYFHELGLLAEDKGDFEEAWKLQSKAKDLFMKLGDEKNFGVMIDRMGNLALKQGKYDLAKELCEESLKMSIKLDDQLGIAISFHQRATLAHLTGESNKARRFFKKSIEIKEQLNNRAAIGISLSLLGLGGVEEHEQNYYQAFINYYNALLIYLDVDRSRVPYALTSFSHLLTKIGAEEFNRIATQVGAEFDQDLSFILKWIKPKI